MRPGMIAVAPAAALLMPGAAAADPPGGGVTTKSRMENCVTPDGLWGRVGHDDHTTATIEGRQQEIYGTACRQPDESWQRVS